MASERDMRWLLDKIADAFDREDVSAVRAHINIWKGWKENEK